ncbi:Uncharacterised protein [Vibrio cholerae]|nr:Uncharacterised protein [Vibrio cholerae]
MVGEAQCLFELMAGLQIISFSNGQQRFHNQIAIGVGDELIFLRLLLNKVQGMARFAEFTELDLRARDITPLQLGEVVARFIWSSAGL